MSRYEVEIPLDTYAHTFAYGYDHPLQTYFWQTFDEEGMPLTDEGGLEPRSGGQLLEAMDKYGVNDIINQQHKNMAALDLPIE